MATGMGETLQRSPRNAESFRIKRCAFHLFPSHGGLLVFVSYCVILYIYRIIGAGRLTGCSGRVPPIDETSMYVSHPYEHGHHHNGGAARRPHIYSARSAFTHLGLWRKLLYDCSSHHFTTSQCDLIELALIANDVYGLCYCVTYLAECHSIFALPLVL